MKKILVLLLFCSIVVIFTGCGKTSSKQATELVVTNLKQGIDLYGNNYQVVTLSPTHFLISWQVGENQTVDIVYNNNTVVEAIPHEGMLKTVVTNTQGTQLYFTDGTGYWYE